MQTLYSQNLHSNGNRKDDILKTLTKIRYEGQEGKEYDTKRKDKEMLFMYGTGTFHPSVSYTSKLDKEYVARWEVRERPGQSLTLQGSLKSIK